MLPISLPELPKPSRTSGESQKRQFLNPMCCIKIRENSVDFLINPFKGPYMFVYWLYRIQEKALIIRTLTWGQASG